MRRRHKYIIYRYRSQLFQLKNVVGIGYGIKEKNGEQTGDDAIVILVKEKQPREELSKQDLIPQAVENYKTDVQEVGELRFLISRKGRVRPAQPGVSIGHYQISAGTFGAVVKDRITGKPLILSNNHVLANQTNGYDGKAKVGDVILQPGKHDAGTDPDDVIAHLERYVPVKTETELASCPVAVELERMVNDFLHLMRPDYSFKLLKHGVTNKVDCAVAKPVRDDYANDDILGIGKVKGLREPELGLEVIKSGRTTGITEGRIKAVDSTVEVRMNDDTIATFEDQIVIDPISQAGDSGSLVLDKNNNAVGLLFAGSDKATVCNKITNVLQELDVSFYIE